MKQRYLSRASAQLEHLNKRLDELRSMAERLGRDRRRPLERALDGARGLRNRAEAKLEDVRRAGEDAWRAFMVPAEAALAELRSVLEQLEGDFCQQAA